MLRRIIKTDDNNFVDEHTGEVLEGDALSAAVEEQAVPAPKSPFIKKPTGLKPAFEIQLARYINTGAALDKVLTTKGKELDGIKKEIKALVDNKSIPIGKYVTDTGNTLSVTQADEYTKPDSQEVFNFLIESRTTYSFKDMFGVGVEKLKNLLGEEKMNSFRKLKGKVLKLSFK